MSTSKKDYESIAAALRDPDLIDDVATSVGVDPSVARRAVEVVASAVADVFEADNPRFDRARWLAAIRRA